jgi:hypothetical protein
VAQSFDTVALFLPLGLTLREPMVLIRMAMKPKMQTSAQYIKSFSRHETKKLVQYQELYSLAVHYIPWNFLASTLYPSVHRDQV